MVSIILVSHYGIAAAMHDAIEKIIGKQERFDYISIEYDLSTDYYESLLKQKIMELKSYGDLIVLSDFLMGTPFNILISLAGKIDFAHISGFNVSMLLYLLQHRNDGAKSLECLCNECVKAGEKGIINVNDLIISLK